MIEHIEGVNILPSWKLATDPSDPPPVRILDADGTLHFSHLKKIAASGVQYLHSVNTTTVPTRDMRTGTITHTLLLGPRPGAKEAVVYRGRRAGKDWEAFEAENPGKEIVTVPEWDEAVAMVASVRRSPIGRGRLAGAKTEVPLTWEEGGLKCSTSGVDILPVGDDLGDLKTTSTTNPDVFKIHAFKMHWAHQLVWYRRGARANGRKVRRLFLLGVERKAPYEVVELQLSSEMEETAERGVDLWLEKLRGYMLSCPRPKDIYDWPGYAAAPVLWEPPAWLTSEDGDDDVDEEDAAE